MRFRVSIIIFTLVSLCLAAAFSVPQFSLADASSASPAVLSATANWLTYHKDLSRDGYDNSTSSIFHIPSLSWKSPVLDGSVYAEPLVYNGLVIVATENNTVFALNAGTGHIVWKKHLGRPVPGATLPCGDINPSGITGTPVIDPVRKLVYVVAYLYPPQRHVLFGLTLAAGHISFKKSVDPPNVSVLVEQQRGALLLERGVVYVPFGGLAGDCGQYHGFVVGADQNGSAKFSYQVPSGREAGIWASSGPAADSMGNIFVSTGNSASNLNFDFGESVIRLSPTLNEQDFFAPTNWVFLNVHDTDVGSTGPTLMNGSALVFQIGKEGIGFLLNKNSLGGIGGQAFSTQVCPSGSGVFAGTAFLNSVLYIPCTSGIVALQVNFGGPSFAVLWDGPAFHPGPPIISGGLIWTVDTNNAVLHALSPVNGSSLFSFNLGRAVHFITPSASAGRIFVAANNTIDAFNV